ncbi:hypothetical protein TSOC_005297, partial [Tetrabaena socialis]
MVPRALLACALGIVVLAAAQPAWPDWFRGNATSGPQRRLTQHAHCGPLSGELVQRVARDNTVLVTVIDKIVWKCFGPSFVENIQAANISYWLVAALDPETSVALAAAGVTQCFNAPQDRLKYKGTETKYEWGSHHWTQTTWNKVHVMKSVYELGVHVVHSDADVVWFNDPHPYFHARLEGPAHIVICTDAVSTGNQKGDGGLEVTTNPHTNINTETKYEWGSHHWTQTTWNKVHVMKSVYELGVHVVHSDADVVWFNDPHPYFHARLEGPAHIVICTDAVSTGNQKGDGGLEVTTNPHTNINTGVYFMKQWAGGLAFLDVWLGWQDKNVGHDQDGFNFVARGMHFHGTLGMPTPTLAREPDQRIYWAAFSPTTAISFLPASSFGNAYTYVNARLWE